MRVNPQTWHPSFLTCPGLSGPQTHKASGGLFTWAGRMVKLAVLQTPISTLSAGMPPSSQALQGFARPPALARPPRTFPGPPSIPRLFSHLFFAFTIVTQPSSRAAARRFEITLHSSPLTPVGFGPLRATPNRSGCPRFTRWLIHKLTPVGFVPLPPTGADALDRP